MSKSKNGYCDNNFRLWSLGLKWLLNKNVLHHIALIRNEEFTEVSLLIDPARCTQICKQWNKWVT